MSNSHLDTEDVEKGLSNIENRMNAAIKIYCDTAAKTMETYAKQNRPWTDRTGAARQRLVGSHETLNEHTERITIAHGVDYGLWLELAKEKKYAILEPTIRLEGPKVIQGLKDFFKNLLN